MGERLGGLTSGAQEFVSFYKKCLASEDVKRRYTEKTVRKLTTKNARIAKQLFPKYDVDNSGTIDVNELEAVLKDLLDLRLDDKQWKSFVRDELHKRDKDENGVLRQISN